MIRNRNLVFTTALNSSPNEDKYIQLPEIATASLPTASTSNEGGLVYDATTNSIKFSNASSWATFGGATTLAALTDVAIASPASGEVLVYDGVNSWDNKALSGDISIGATGVAAIETGVIVNADVNASAAIAFSKLATLSRGYILIGNASNVATAADVNNDGQILIGDGTDLNTVAVTGDIGITNAGLTSISSGVIVNADVNASAAIVESKLAFSTSTGHTHDGVNSKLVSVGTSNNLAQTGSLEAGANDLAWSWTSQTSAGTVGIRDLNLATGTTYFVFETSTQTLTNKTLTSPVITTPQINDTSADHQYVFAVSELAADRTVTLPLLAGNDTFVFADFIQTLTNKTLTSPVLTTPQINDTSADHQYVFAVSELVADRIVTLPLLAGNDTFVFNDFVATLTNKTLTSPVLTTPQINDTSADHQYVFVVSELAADRNVTLPLLGAADVFVFEAFAQTLTNKTVDAASNTLSNLSAAEVDVGTVGTDLDLLPFIISKDVSNSATTVIFNANAPYKFRVLDVWTVNIGAGNSGTWKIDNGTNDITTAISYTASDTALIRATSIDDAYHAIAANGSLRCINSVNTDDAVLYILAIRVD